MTTLRNLMIVNSDNLPEAVDKILSNRPVSWPQRAPIIGSFLAFEQENTEVLSTAEGHAGIHNSVSGFRISYKSIMFFSGFRIGGYTKPAYDFDTLIVEDGQERPVLHIASSRGLVVNHGLEVHEQDLIIGHLAKSVFDKLSKISTLPPANL